MLIQSVTDCVSTRHSGWLARKLRANYPCAIYQLLNRGDRREAVFLDEPDHELFLNCLVEVCARIAGISRIHMRHVGDTKPKPDSCNSWTLGTPPTPASRRSGSRVR